MRVLVSGAKGMLGTDLCPIFAHRHDLHATDIDEMDVRQPDQVFRTFREFRPELVLHLAALTDVDGCEKTPDAAFQTNTIGTQIMALACRKFSAPMVYISTLSVFDGSKVEAYTEFDQPNPQSHYSRAKHQGELVVQTLLPEHYIVRAGWMFGGGPKDKKFVAKIIDLARSRSVLQIVDDKFGSPVYTHDLAQGLLKLVETGWYGTYHMLNTGAPASRYEVAQHILRCASISNCRLDPVPSTYFPLPAPRPRMEAGRNLHLDLLGCSWMRPWPDALREYIETTLLSG